MLIFKVGRQFKTSALQFTIIITTYLTLNKTEKNSVKDHEAN